MIYFLKYCLVQRTEPRALSLLGRSSTDTLITLGSSLVNMSKNTCIFSNYITAHVAASFKRLLLSRYGNASVGSGEVGYKEKAQPPLPMSSRSCSVQMFSCSAVGEPGKCSGHRAGSGWGGAATVFKRNPTLKQVCAWVQNQRSYILSETLYWVKFNKHD